MGAGGWRVSQNAGQQIHFGILNTTTGTGGYLSSTQTYDTIRMVCNVENNEFTVIGAVGNITII